METGSEKSKSAVGLQTGSSFRRHFDEKPKIGVFLGLVFPLTWALRDLYWGQQIRFWT